MEIPFDVLGTTQDSKPFVSMARYVPYTEENLEFARKLAMARYKCKRSDIKVRWRNWVGGRGHHPMHLIKREATHFDVYYQPRKPKVQYTTDMFGHIIPIS
jgi:hypothetical protein